LILKGEIAGISFVNEFVDCNDEDLVDLQAEISDYWVRYDNRLFIKDLKYSFNTKPINDLLKDYKRQGLKKLKRGGRWWW
tara:strand:- start:204 stop:443 length:240 start_codon:yes stop_codon:yes gene_type:complete